MKIVSISSVKNIWKFYLLGQQSIAPSPQHVTIKTVAQSCPTLCDPMDCSSPGSSVHEIFPAKILEWVAISFSRGSSQPRDWTRDSCTAGRFFTDWATREAPTIKIKTLINSSLKSLKKKKRLHCLSKKQPIQFSWNKHEMILSKHN